MNLLNLITIIPELFLLNFTLILLWFGLYLRYKINFTFSRSFGLLSVFLLTLTFFLFVNSQFVSWSAINMILESNNLSYLLKLFLLVVTIFVLLGCYAYEKLLSLQNLDVEVNIIRLLIVVALLLLISINNFIYLFFILELYSLATYILVGYKGKISVFSAEAALKYFLVGTAFSILMAYAIVLIYLSTGLITFSELHLYITLHADTALIWRDCDLFSFAILLLLVSFFFKLAAAPFHFWAPDVYEGTPLSSMFFLFVVPKIAIFGFLMNLSFLWAVPISLAALLISALLSFLVGAIMGLFQKKMKRLLTYSMINNNGFFLIALVANGILGHGFLLFFLLVYTFTLLGLFSSLLSLQLYNTGSSVNSLWSWTSLFFVNKIQSLMTSFLLFSSAGLPPLVGFLTKFLILLSVFLGYANLYYAIIVILFLTPLSCFYYIRVIKVMAFNKKKIWLFLKPVPTGTAYLLSLSCVGLILFFLSSGLFLNIIFLILL